MADIQVRKVNDNVAIAYDRWQFIVQTFRGVAKGGKFAGQEKWEAKSFCRDKYVLMQLCIRHGATEFEAYEAVRDLPKTIDEYIDARVGEPPPDSRDALQGTIAA